MEQILEVHPSPCERYTREGFSAERRFLVPWEKREQFALELLGQADPLVALPALSYPGKQSVRVVEVSFRPLDPQLPESQQLLDLARQLNSYDGQFAIARVRYRQAEGQSDRSDFDAEPGTRITYRMKPLVRFEQLSPQGWHWTDEPQVSLPQDVPLEKLIPLTEHRVTWHEVVDPPWQTISRLQGTVNASAFLGCGSETLLFVGAEANKLFRGDIDADPSAFAWEIEYLFLERSVKYAGQTYGWNHRYRPSPAGWAQPTDGVSALYDTADFSLLFRSAADQPQ